ncbi:MAG: hypothetical protein E6J26_03285 [Chloroflexi bacterium]|nr:MAG: hypothetical protein E6J26_03285 [Chloroflexota bacterium]
MSAKIVVNGKEYNSVEEMPPDIRQSYEKAMTMLGRKTLGILADTDHNGVPDLFEKFGATDLNFTTTSRMIVYEGKTYNSVDELPPEAKEKYQQAMAKLGGDADNNGIPDVLEGKALPSGDGTSSLVSVNTITTSAKPIKFSVGTAASNIWLWLLVVVLVALVATLAVLLIIK